jgi:hypothetical protein
LVEHELPKLEVAGSNPVARSTQGQAAGARQLFAFLALNSRNQPMPSAPARTAVLLALAMVGCTDAVRAPITIVVDTDLARAREEQGRLEALRAGVQGDRADLDAARVELERARQRLEQTARGPQRDALVAEIRALEGRVCPPPPEVDVAAAVAAGVEAGVARALAARPVEVTPPSPVPPPAAAASPAAPSSPADLVPRARAKVQAARAALRARQLDLADLEGAVALADRVEGLAGRGDGAGALALAEQLEAEARAVVVDRPLLLRRYERLNTRAKSATLDAARRQVVTTGLGRASTAISRGDQAGALTALGDVAATLEAP